MKLDLESTTFMRPRRIRCSLWFCLACVYNDKVVYINVDRSDASPNLFIFLSFMRHFWLLLDTSLCIYSKAVFLLLILVVWWHSSSLILLRSLYQHSLFGRTTSGNGFKPRNTSVENLVFLFSFCPSRSTGEWVIILQITSSIAGHCSVFSLHSYNNVYDMFTTSLHTLPIVSFGNKKYAVVK